MNDDITTTRLYHRNSKVDSSMCRYEPKWEHTTGEENGASRSDTTNANTKNIFYSKLPI